MWSMQPQCRLYQTRSSPIALCVARAPPTHVRCPCQFFHNYCNQDLSDFAASSVFQASAKIHECMVDVNSPPLNRGINSMVVPQGFPSPPGGFSLLCCHRHGPPPQCEQLPDRKMEWSPLHNPRALEWSPQWICVGCSRAVDSSSLPDYSSTPCSQCGADLHLVLDFEVDVVCTVSTTYRCSSPSSSASCECDSNMVFPWPTVEHGCPVRLGDLLQ